MHLQPRPLPATRHYQQLEAASRASASGPYSLVSALYEELLHSLDIVIATLEATGLASDIHVARTRSILSALEDSLNFKDGGNLSPVLARIYRSAADELTNADLNRAKLIEYRAALSTIAYAWTTLAAV